MGPPADAAGGWLYGRVSSLQQASRAGISAYLEGMRARDLLHPRPEGLYCPPGDFFIDPVRPVDAGADHPRPFRPCPRRPRRRCWRRGRRSTSWACAMARILPARRRRRRSARRSRSTASTVTFHPAGHVLGSAQICVEHERHAHRRLRRLQAPPRPDLRRRSSRSPAMSSSPRRPSACRSSAIRPTRTRSAGCSNRRRSFPSARIWSAPMRSARRSASSGCCAMPAMTEPIYIHGALEKLCDYYQSQGIDLGDAGAGDGRQAATRATSPAPSSSARHRPSPTAGRGASPIRSRASPPAGCASASAPSSAASNCR